MSGLLTSKKDFERILFIFMKLTFNLNYILNLLSVENLLSTCLKYSKIPFKPKSTWANSYGKLILHKSIFSVNSIIIYFCDNNTCKSE